MIHSVAGKQPKSSSFVDPKGSSGKMAIMPDTIRSQEMIRARAHELYEGRGREPGQHEQDWLRAEQEILSQK